MKHGLCAAIDLGTNTALLLVARRDDCGALEIVEDHCQTPRLGTGVARTGMLDAAACERTLAALAFFATRLDALGVPRSATRAVGTAVLRRARDARAFVQVVRARTGLEIEIITAEEEARLSQVAITAEGASRDAIVIDVGGGSTEVSCTALGLRASVPIGAVVLTETFLANPALEPGGFAALCARATTEVAQFPAGIAAGRTVFALGGTGVNLACLALGFPRFDHLAAEGAVFETRHARAFAEKLAALTLEQRLALPIEAERAEILPAGMAVLAAVFERLSAKEVRVTGRGLRFGVVHDLLGCAET